MVKNVKDGIWPTMMTPYKEDFSVDYEGILRLINWYKDAGAHGIFTLCYSSEIWLLTLRERLKMTRFIADNLPEGMELVVSGHVSRTLDEQINEMKALRDAGAPVLILIGNRLAAADEDDDRLISRVEVILNALPDMSFGLYESPFPYKRVFAPETIYKLSQTGRFVFMKETSCHLESFESKVKAAKGTNFKIFNANTATFIQSMRYGGSGFSGVMCNFHVDLYVELYEAYMTGNSKLVDFLKNFLGVFSVFELQNYPYNAKAYMSEELGITERTRLKSEAGITYGMRVELEELRYVTEYVRQKLKSGKY